MILACNHISKAFADETVLSDAVFHINEGERAAIVGINGAGKTTLLRIIVGELPADSGEIVTAKGSTIGYLPQQQGYHSDKTIYEELLAVKSDVIEMDEKIRAMEQQMTTLEGAELERVSCKRLLKMVKDILTKVKFSASLTVLAFAEKRCTSASTISPVDKKQGLLLVNFCYQNRTYC